MASDDMQGTERHDGKAMGAIGNGYELTHGDCLLAMGDIPDGSIDLVLTDPPYNLAAFMMRRATNLRSMRPNHFYADGWDDMTEEEWAKSMDAFLAESARVLRRGGALLMLMSIIRVETVVRLAEGHGLYYKTTGVWHKTNPMPRNMSLHFVNAIEPWVYFVNGAKTGTFNNGGIALHDFVETPVAPRSERALGSHPTQKPVALMEHFVRILSDPGDVILDPFMGSGSTGVAAITNGRRFVGIELDERYYDTAERRVRDAWERASHDDDQR